MESHKAFAGFELVEQSSLLEKTSKSSLLAQLANPSVTFFTFPLAKNKVLVRLVNLEDKIDGGQAETIYVNVNQIAQDLYKQANPLYGEAKFKITETTISGSLSSESLAKR